MIRIDVIWLALGASDLRGGIDRLLGQVVRGFALGAQAHHAYVFANRRAPRRDSGSYSVSREQFDWLVAGLPWQRLSAPRPTAITVI